LNVEIVLFISTCSHFDFTIKTAWLCIAKQGYINIFNTNNISNTNSNIKFTNSNTNSKSINIYIIISSTTI